MENEILKKYINCYLFEHLDEVAKKFMSMMKGYRICEFSHHSSKSKFFNYELQLLDFFNGIVQDDPLRHTEEVLGQWRNSELHSECNMHPILPEDLIAYYSVLKETLLHFSSDSSLSGENLIKLEDELGELDQAIQKKIASTFLMWQEEIHKQEK